METKRGRQMPSLSNVNHFLKGIEYAEQIALKTKKGETAAAAIRKELTTLNLHKERKVKTGTLK